MAAATVINDINILRCCLCFQLADLCDAYRLTGISVASQESKRTCFRCETFFNCKLKLNSLHTSPKLSP